MVTWDRDWHSLWSPYNHIIVASSACTDAKEERTEGDLHSIAIMPEVQLAHTP